VDPTAAPRGRTVIRTSEIHLIIHALRFGLTRHFRRSHSVSGAMLYRNLMSRRSAFF